MSSEGPILARKLAAYKAMESTKKCGGSYEKNLNIETAKLTASYTATGVTYVAGSGNTAYNTNDVLLLLDNGNPAAQVRVTAGSGTITAAVLIKSPIYAVRPSTATEYSTITLTNANVATPIGLGAKFKLTGLTSLSCYGCT